MVESARKKLTRTRLGWLIAIFITFWVLLTVGITKVWIRAQVLGLTSVEITKLYLAIEKQRMRQNELIAERARLLDPRRLDVEARRLGMVLPKMGTDITSAEDGGNVE